MKTIFCISTLLLLMACKDTGTNQQQNLNIQFTLVSGRIWADFRGPIHPEDDGVRCEFTVVVRNVSQSMALEQASMPEAEVFGARSRQRIGVVQLYSAWDGHVAAGESDTVRLIKRANQGPTLVPIPCDSLVLYKIGLKQQESILGFVQRDSVLFECYQ